MKLRLTPRALADLQNLYTYIAEHQRQPQNARLVISRIEATFDRILEMPQIGKSSYMPDTRELTISNLPCTVVYRIVGDIVEVTTVSH
ncbi:MAG: plasmid stabilization system protein ParE [Parasphingorhabdus sp.]|jgi:plasmid stabilization system protein ParE